MSDTASGRGGDALTGDPEGEWDTVVRRISDRIKKRPGGTSSTQSSLDLAGELVRLERRALDAEATLARERDEYSVRVRDMEEKLRRLEPWLRQLKGEYQRAAVERDALRDELNRAKEAAPAADVTKSAVIESEREAALHEAEAARAARDAAIADAEALKKRIESDRANLQSSMQERIAAAEKARDQALEDLKQMRKSAGESRRAEDEIKRLVKEIEQLGTTTSAHKAVARAAQEEVETLKARVAELDKAGRSKAESVEHEGRRAQELAKQLEQTRAELAVAKRTAAEVEAVASALSVDNEEFRREIDAKIQSLDSAKKELEQTKKSVEKLRAETADAERQAEQARTEALHAIAEVDEAKRESASAVEEAGRAKSTTEAAKSAAQKAREEFAAAQRDAAMGKELAEEAMRGEAEARRLAEEAAAKLAAAEEESAVATQKIRELDDKCQELFDKVTAESRAREDAERRVAELDGRVEQAEQLLPDLKSQIELATGRVHALETDNANLQRTLEEERESGAKRFDAAETSWKSQVRAAESRSDVDVQRERERAREMETTIRAVEDRAAQSIAARESELARIRGVTRQFLAAKSRELVAGVAEILGFEPPKTSSTTTPVLEDIAAVESSATTQTTPITMAVTSSVSGPVLAPGALAAGPADWDRLISDVEQLWTEVEGMKPAQLDAAREDTKSTTLEDAAAVVAQARAEQERAFATTDVVIVEPTAAPTASEPTPTADESDDTRSAAPGEPTVGRRRRRR